MGLLSEVYLLSRDPHRALATSDKALQIDPQSAPLWAARAEIHQALGNAQQAMNDVNHALTLHPRLASGYRNRARLYIDAGAWDKALADLECFGGLFAHDSLTSYYLGACCYHLLRTGEAMFFANQALRLANAMSGIPVLDAARALRLRGACHNRLGQYDAAITDLDEAIHLFEDGGGSKREIANAWYHRGEARLVKKEAALALADFNQAIRLDPQRAAYYYRRGCALKRSADPDNALRDFNKAIRLDPNEPESYLSRADIFVAKGMNKKAIQDLSAVIARVREWNYLLAVATLTRADCYIATGQWEEALNDLNRLIGGYKDQEDIFDWPRALRLRAMCHDLYGQYDDAEADRQAALRIEREKAKHPPRAEPN